MIEFKNVNKVYDGKCTALEDLNLQIGDGEFVFVVGPSESGKSTLFRLLTQMDKPTSGSIQVGEWDLCKMKRRKIPYYRRKLGIIFKDPRLFPNQTVFENIALALRIVGEHSADVRMKSLTALKMVEFDDAAKKMPALLSPFDQQRVALARALAGGPGIIIADEPTGNMDSIRAKEFIELLIRIHSRFQKTVLVFTNGKEFAEEFGQRTIFLSHGKIEEDRPAVKPLLEEAVQPEEDSSESLTESPKESEEAAPLTGADQTTQIFTAIDQTVSEAVSRETMQFDAVTLVSQDTQQFNAVALNEQDAVQCESKPLLEQDTVQFDTVALLEQDTVQFKAVAASPEEKESLANTVVDLPILSIATEESSEDSAAEKDSADGAAQENAPSTDQPTENLENTVTFAAVKDDAQDIFSQVMKMLETSKPEPKHRRVFTDLTISDDWNYQNSAHKENEQPTSPDSSSAQTTEEDVQ